MQRASDGMWSVECGVHDITRYIYVAERGRVQYLEKEAKRRGEGGSSRVRARVRLGHCLAG